MHQLSFMFFLLALLNLVSLARSYGPLMWVVGLREGRSLDDHVAFMDQPIPIQELRPDLNGYTASVSDDDEELFRRIRGDAMVGFAVKVPYDYFGYMMNEQAREVESLIQDELWDEDDLSRMPPMSDVLWHDLQDRDLQILLTDNTRKIVPLEWKVQLKDGFEFNEVINSITKLKFHPLSVYQLNHRGKYVVYFENEKQESKYLSMMSNDDRVQDVWPARAYRLHGYDEPLANGTVIEHWHWQS